MQTGHRPVSAFSEILEHLCSSLASKLDEIESESGSTRRRGLEMALSDTTILMTYSLLEGFFFEEYKYYLEKDPPRNNKLEMTIEDLLIHLRISNEKISREAALISALRAARNAVAHRNGALKEDEKVEIENQFGAGISTINGYPVATISTLIEMTDKAELLISEYSHAAVQSAIRAQADNELQCRVLEQ